VAQSQGPVKWDRRSIVIGAGLIVLGFVAVFVPIWMLAHDLAAAFGAAGGASASPPPDIGAASLAIPIGALAGFLFVVAGMAVIARARRRPSP
jgi:hypothetical protein